MEKQEDDADDEEYPRNLRRHGCHSGHAERSGDDGDDQKHQRVIQHGQLPAASNPAAPSREHESCLGKTTLGRSAHQQSGGILAPNVEMAEVLLQFETVVASESGEKYYAQACGAARADGMWEGWIEFVPADGGTPLRSQRETTQPNRSDAVYWATGLTPVYLAGALSRALNPIVRKKVPPAQPVFDRPAAVATEARSRHGSAVLDPYAAYEKGETMFRQELNAISTAHLVKIIREYGFSDVSDDALTRLPDEALIEIVLAAARRAAVK
jgi:hypothetical protein